MAQVAVFASSESQEVNVRNGKMARGASNLWFGTWWTM